MVFDAQTLLSELQSYKTARCICLAYSGGVDSHVLLHALSTIKQKLDCTIKAVHINHNLQDDAEHWVTHCQKVCEQLNIPYQSIKVDVDSIAQEGVEAAARHARYQALAQCLNENDLLLTAQHADDQAETLMLQLLRGSGVPGLAAMPAKSPFAKGWHLRLLLNYSRQSLLDYAHQHQLLWIEDPSNQDDRFDRNYLRHQVMPQLQERWPATSQLLSRSASHLAEANDLLQALAQQDLASMAHQENSISVSDIQKLSPARQRNVLRCWLKLQDVAMPSTRILEQLQHTVLAAEIDSQPLLQWAGVEARRYQDRLYIMTILPAHDDTQNIFWDGKTSITLTTGDSVRAASLIQQGLDAQQLINTSLEIRFRQGGERCRLTGAKCSKSLKHLFQEWQIPPWQRNRIPLLYINGQLAMIMGFAVCEGF